MKKSYVYILASQRNGTLYIGVTADFVKRIWEHKTKLAGGFTSQYSVNKLIYYEEHQEISIAIQREKRLKEGPRKWKLHLIEKSNPYWADLHDTLVI